ncbi:hypothetical protein ABIE66_003189 [Peribacillus sp. B2I2]
MRGHFTHLDKELAHLLKGNEKPCSSFIYNQKPSHLMRRFAVGIMSVTFVPSSCTLSI